MVPPIDCPCLATYPASSVTTYYTSDGSSSPVATIHGTSYIYPTDYGLVQCDAHDAGLQPLCGTSHADGSFDPLNNPAFCSASWCYVDPTDCNVARENSSYFSGTNSLWFSYAACESANQFNEYYLETMPRPPPMPPAKPPSPPRPPPPPPRRVVRFGFFPEPQPFMVACARGWFDTPEFEVICLPQSSGGYATAKLDRGDLDVSVLGSTPWAAAVSRGVDLTAFYVVHSKGESQGLMVRSNIVAPDDLQGKTIGAPFGSTAHQIMLFLATLFPLTSFTIVDVPNSISRIQSLWDAGEIDGMFCWGDPFAHLKTQADTRLLLTAANAAQWGLQTFNLLAARSAVMDELPTLLPHLSNIFAILDRSWMSLDHEWHPAMAPGGEEGFLTSINDACSAKPYATSSKERQAILEALQLFEFVNIRTQLGCEWFESCLDSDDGANLATKSADASTFLHDLKLLASFVPAASSPGDGSASSLLELFSSAIDSAPLAHLDCKGCLPALPTTGQAVPPRGAGAGANGSSCSSFAAGTLPAQGHAQALTATAIAQTFGDGAGGVDGRSYSDDLDCAWTVAPSNSERRLRLRAVSARVWTGDTLTIYAMSHRGLADVLLAKIVGAPHGQAAGWPPLAARGPLIVRFTTDGRSESFYNAASDRSEDGDGFVVEYIEEDGVTGCSSSSDCSGQPCDAEGECACAEAGRGGADCSYPRCLGTQFATAPGMLKSAESWGEPGHLYDNDAECVFVLSVADLSHPDVRLAITHDLEEGFDFLDVYAGAGLDGARYARIFGTGVTRLTVPATSGAATLHFTSDAQGRRGGFNVTFASGRFSSDIGCPVGAFGMDCAAQSCMTQNAPMLSPSGSLTTGQPVPKLADCSWNINPAGCAAFRLNVTTLDLEAARSVETADRAELTTVEGWQLTLWAQACTDDEECVLPQHTGVCTATGVCAVETSYDVPAASASLRFLTDLNDGGLEYSGVALSWIPLLDCPVDVLTTTTVQCLLAGGSCEEGLCVQHEYEVSVGQERILVGLNCSCAPGEPGSSEGDTQLHASILGALLVFLLIVGLLVARVEQKRRRRQREGSMRYVDDDSECLPHVPHGVEMSDLVGLDLGVDPVDARKSLRRSSGSTPAAAHALGHAAHSAAHSVDHAAHALGDAAHSAAHSVDHAAHAVAHGIVKMTVEARHKAMAALHHEHMTDDANQDDLLLMNSAAVLIQLHFRCRQAILRAKGRGQIEKHRTHISLLPTEMNYDLFLSHVWGSGGGQEKMRLLKVRLREMMPSLRIFLDVDDLKEGRGMEGVDCSHVVLVFCTDGYFKSPNCMRELLRAALVNKPIILMGTQVRANRGRGQTRPPTLLPHYPECHALAQGPGTVAIHEVEGRLEWTMDQLAPWGLEDEIHEWGCEVPTAAQLCEALFRAPPVEFDTLLDFQVIWFRLVAERLLVKGHGATYVRGELTIHSLHQKSSDGSCHPWLTCNKRGSRRRKPALPPPRAGCRFHLYCSPNNSGALQLCEEVQAFLAEAGPSSTLLWTGHTSTDQTRKNDAGQLFGRRATGVAEAQLACEQMLLYLNADTWTSGQASKFLAEEVTSAMASGVRLLLVHEAPSWDKTTPGACRFDDFFSCERGTTPRHLLQHGIYTAIALQLRAAPLRVASLVQLVRRMAEPVRILNNDMRQRQHEVIARIKAYQLQRAAHASYPVETPRPKLGTAPTCHTYTRM